MGSVLSLTQKSSMRIREFDEIKENDEEDD
jgi:hypothetical protein